MNKQLILDFIKFMRNSEGCEFMWQDDSMSDPDDIIVFSPCSEGYLESCVEKFLEKSND